VALNVLLVGPEVESLGELAAALRARGLTVMLADRPNVAVEQSQRVRVKAVLIAESIAGDPAWAEAFNGQADLANVPRFTLVAGSQAAGEEQLPYTEPDLMARRLWAMESTPPPVSNLGGDFRGDLQHVSVTDLLQLLGINRRTGTLTITTTVGTGEVRLAEGEIVDAVYRGLEGSKALYRLLQECAGSFAFVGGAIPTLRRVEQQTGSLLLEGLRQVDEVKRRRALIGTEDDALESLVAPETATGELGQRVLHALQAPHTLDELLDQLPYSDLEIVEAVQALIDGASIRRIERGAARAELADADQMPVLANMVRQLRHPGFWGNPRIVLYAAQSRLVAATRSLGRIADTWRPAEITQVASTAHTLATVRLSDGVELDVVGLPDVRGYGPLWGLTLPGTAAVIVLGQEPSETIEAACAVFAIPVLRADALLGTLDEGDPQQMALLIRAAVESATGQ
jgi:hypothetical protein